MKKPIIKRSLRDGPVSVTRLSDGTIQIDVAHDSVGYDTVMTEFNARQLLAALSFALRLPLTKRALDQIEE